MEDLFCQLSCITPVLKIMNVKSVTKFQKSHSLANVCVLVGICFTPTLRVKNKFFNYRLEILMVTKGEMAFNKRGVHKVSQSFYCHHFLIACLGKKLLDLIFECHLLMVSRHSKLRSAAEAPTD